MAQPSGISANFPISNALVPAKGPKALRVPMDMTAAASYDVDLTSFVNGGALGGMQSMFVDNSLNNAQVIVTFSGSSQKITIPPLSQGVYPVLANPNTPQFNVASSGGTGSVILFAFDFASVYFQWTASGSGALIVSDAILDACVTANKMNVIDTTLIALMNTVISAGLLAVQTTPSRGNPTSRSTITVAASTPLMIANAARKYILIKAPETADIWINPIGGAAAVSGADCFKIPAGATYESDANYVWTGAINYFCASAALQLNALEG